MISLKSSLSLKLHSLVYHRNIFGSFSKNVRERSSGVRKNFGTPSEIFGRWSEIFGKSSKTPSSACLYNKKNITRRLEDMNFIFSWQKQYFTRYARSKILFCHSKIKFISSRHRVISSINFVFSSLLEDSVSLNIFLYKSHLF